MKPDDAAHQNFEFPPSPSRIPAQVHPVQAIPVGISPGNSMALVGEPHLGQVLRSTNYVVDLGLEIERGFRRKLLTLLLLQLCISLAVALVLRFAVPMESFLGVVFPAQSIQTIILGALCLLCLPALTYVKKRHPWNLVCTTMWSIAWGVFLAAAHVPGGLIRSNGFLLTFGMMIIGVFCLLITATTFTYYDETLGERRLWQFRVAGWIPWLVMIVASIIFAAQVPGAYTSIGHVLFAQGFASLLFAWIVYDANKVCQKMEPDEYMTGVTTFYTDFLLVCCCCLVMGCLSSAAS